ncbi:7741_t:CDS:1 [Cetraspora pellucida]|uniref:7741_t:CDS:1 n=1 Tax=Cetraspora pellucida TaxID=1433469 RepID=A0A9N9HV50_9GLOM|nr:7741_t:CDS:1 [Cetraspora pellucida]
MENFSVIPNGSTSSTSIPNNNEAVVTSGTSMPNNNEAVVTSSTLTSNNNEAVVTSSTLTPNNNEVVVIGNMYNTRKNWIEITGDDNKKYWKCIHCHEKTYAIKTSRTHLKNHTMICPNSPLGETPNEGFKPVTKEDVDNSIVDLVVVTGMPFNILINLFFLKMTKNLCYATYLYKIPHPTTISQHLTGNIFDLRLNFVMNILAKTSGQILLTCDG